MEDIARLSGLSRATVSAVLNGKAGIREKTRQQVLETMRRHGLQHRLLAPLMRVHFSRLFAIVIPDMRNMFYAEAIAGFLDTMRAYDNYLLTYPTDGTHEDEVRSVNAMMELRPAGCVVIATQRQKSQVHLQRIMDAGIPLILGGGSPGIETHTVDLDNQPGSKLAVDHLIRKGHRRIACVAGAQNSTVAKERGLGFVESLLEHGVPFDDSMIVWTEATSESGYVHALEVLRNGSPRPTALACFNDAVAVGVYRAAHELGLRIPEDLSVVGFDDIEICKVLGPPLTTVSVQPRKVGETAAEILISVLKGEVKGRFVHRLMRADLVERGSVKAL
jgi:DNA-binding LacI/PurR family transcriptional regulator